MQSFVPQYQAILFRRWTMVKRSLKSVIISVIGTIIFSGLAIIANYLMKTLLTDKADFPQFGTERQTTPHIAIAGSTDKNLKTSDIITNFIQIYKLDTNEDPEIHLENSIDNINAWLYKISHDWAEPEFVNMGLYVNDKTVHPSKTSIVSSNNATGGLFTNEFTHQVHATRAAWKTCFGTDIKIGASVMLGKIMDMAFGILAPMLIVCGLLSIVPLLITQPIVDIRGEVRAYMQSCTLKLVPYWCATFTIDMGLWTLTTLLVWALFCIFSD